MRDKISRMSDLTDTQHRRLYHFTPAHFALDDIRRTQLKIAQISDLNDPFELRCMDTSAPRIREACDGWRDEASKLFGVLCFSERWDDILQWAHYADRHRGICLGFEVTGGRSKFGQVRYVKAKDPWLDKPDLAFAWRSLTTKCDVWEYEHEWRVFTTLKESIRIDGTDRELYFVKFGRTLILKDVFIGAASRTSSKEVFDALADCETEVRVARVHLADSSFQLKLTDCVKP
jgi:hypothetical protein